MRGTSVVPKPVAFKNSKNDNKCFYFIFQTIWTCQLNASLLVYSRAAVGTLIML